VQPVDRLRDISTLNADFQLGRGVLVRPPLFWLDANSIRDAFTNDVPCLSLPLQNQLDQNLCGYN